MRITESIESPGIFWHPSEPDKQTPGILNVSTDGQVTLQVFGTSTPSADASVPALVPAPEPFSTRRRVDRIVGVIKDHAVTLDDCFYGRYNYNFGGTISDSTIHASHAYFGALYEENEEVTFDSVTFWLEGLHEWMMLSSYTATDRSTNNNLKMTLTSAPVEPVVVTLEDGTVYQFDLSRSLPGIGPTASSVTFRQEAHVTIRTSDPQPLSHFLTAIFPIEVLLSLAMDQSTVITRVMALTPALVRKVDDDDRRLPIDVYGRLSSTPATSQEVSWHKMLFTYRDVQDRFESMLKEWIAHCGASEPAIRLYFAIALGGYRYADGEFLSTTQAVEALHRSEYEQEEYMPDSDFNDLLASIGSVIPVTHRDRILHRLQHANEPSFRRRLKDAFSDFADSFGSNKETNSLVSRIVDARNYLTHHDSETTSAPPDTESLVRMQLNLEALFQMHMLRVLGFKLSEIDKISRDRLDHKLNVRFV